MDNNVAVIIKMLEHANSTEINQNVLIKTISNLQKLEENETGVYCSWKDAKIKFLKELMEEANLVKDVVKDLEEPK